MARRNSVIDASSVRKAACDVSVTLDMFCQRMIGLERLGVKHVETGVTDMAAFKRVEQRSLVHQRAARGVDQNHAGFHARDTLLAQEPAGFVIEDQIERHHV